MSTVLHDYWRSSAAYRLRIALNLKGVDYTQVPVNLRVGEQYSPNYRAVAPHGLVPALEVDGTIMIETPAILEWMELRWPRPSLLPQDREAAAIVRTMGALIACDIHPIANLRVLNALRSDFGASDAQISAWIARWIGEGFAALELLIARHGAGYAFSDYPTLADCYLVPQLFNAQRYGVDLSGYPHLTAAGDKAGELPAFAAAHPDRQMDAV